MRPAVLLLLLLAAAAAVGCGPRVPPGTPFVRLERTECLGECPVYSVTLYRTGNALYQGRRFALYGKHWRKASPAEVNRLIAAVAAAPRWRCDPQHFVTDYPSSILTVSLDGRTHRIVHYHGNPCAPDELLIIEADIERAAGVDPYLAPPPPPE